MPTFYWYVNRDPNLENSADYPRISENDIVRSNTAPAGKYYIREYIDGTVHSMTGSPQNKYTSIENTYGSKNRIISIIETISTKLIDTYVKMVKDNIKKKTDAALAAHKASPPDESDEMNRFFSTSTMRKKHPAITNALRSKSNIKLPLNIVSSTLNFDIKKSGKSKKKGSMPVQDKAIYIMMNGELLPPRTAFDPQYPKPDKYATVYIEPNPNQSVTAHIYLSNNNDKHIKVMTSGERGQNPKFFRKDVEDYIKYDLQKPVAFVQSTLNVERKRSKKSKPRSRKCSCKQK